MIICLANFLKRKQILRFSTHLFNLKLGEKGDEPLEGPLLPVDPEEVHLPQVHHLRLEVICPTVGTLWTCISSGPIPKNLILYNTTLIWKPFKGVNFEIFLKKDWLLHLCLFATCNMKYCDFETDYDKKSFTPTLNTIFWGHTLSLSLLFNA